MLTLDTHPVTCGGQTGPNGGRTINDRHAFKADAHHAVGCAWSLGMVVSCRSVTRFQKNGGDTFVCQRRHGLPIDYHPDIGRRCKSAP